MRTTGTGGRRSRALRVAGIAIVITTAIGASTTRVGARTGGGTPAATIAPASGLLDGQFVTVAWTGFPKSTRVPKSVAVAQCNAAPANALTDCAPSKNGVDDTQGAGTLTLQIHTGSLQSADGTTQFTCDLHHTCNVVAFVDNSLPLTGGAQPTSVVPLAFGFPASDCPHGGNGVFGTGGEAAYRATLAWEAAACQPPSSLDVQYARTESVDGKNAFIGDQAGLPAVDYAATSEPFTAAEQARLAQRHKAYSYAPVAASGLVFVFHGVDRVTGQPLTHVTLTPGELAHIFNGERTSLPTVQTDPESQDILDLNPGVSFVPNLQAYGRLDHAAGTLELTTWMLAAAKTEWQELPPWVATRPSASGVGNETLDYQSPTDLMPDGLQGPGAANQLVNGSDNLGLLVAGDGSIGDNPNTTVFGYLDASTAAFYGLPTVCIQLDPNWRTTGTPCVAATPSTIAAALAAARRDSDGTVTLDPSAVPAGAYPLLDVTYLVLPTRAASAAKASALRSFVDYAVTSGQQPSVLPPSYAPLPSDLVAQAKHAASSISGPAPTPPPPPGTTTTLPTTRPDTGGAFDGGGSSGDGIGSFGDGGTLPPGAEPTTTPSDSSSPPGTRPTVQLKGGRASGDAAPISAVRYPPAGPFLSDAATWWVLGAITLFVLLGLTTTELRGHARNCWHSLLAAARVPLGGFGGKRP
jgi:ABC-type phosphate transport system substrate-binding protein